MPWVFSDQVDALGALITLCHRLEQVENGTSGGRLVKNQHSTSHLQLLFPNTRLLCPPAQGSGWQDLGVPDLLLCLSH